MNAINYFAYGSNMSSRRLKKRCPSVQFKCVGYVKDYELKFNKKSKDNSGKANLVKQPGKVVWGVVFSISKEDLEELRKIEKGYELTFLEKVIIEEGKEEKSYTFIANGNDNVDDNLLPYDWYLQHCLKGAQQHKLPNDYIKFLKRFRSMPDSDQNRANRERKLYTSDGC